MKNIMSKYLAIIFWQRKNSWQKIIKRKKKIKNNNKAKKMKFAKFAIWWKTNKKWNLFNFTNDCIMKK